MSTKEKISDTDRQQFWQRIMEARRESGLSVVAFCQKEGISEAAYYYWRKKLSQDGSQPLEKSSPAFLEVVMPERKATDLELVLSSGHTVRIPTGVDPQRVREFLLVLQEAGLC